MTQLSAERSKIAACESALRTYGTEAQQMGGAEAYRKAKSEMDGVLDGLIDALAGKGETKHAVSFEQRLHASINERIAFCRTVEPLVPSTKGERQIFQDVYNDTLKPAMAAVRSIIGRRTAADSERRTISTQLEAARWPAYGRASKQ